MGAKYKVHTKLLTEFETLGVMGENNSGIIIEDKDLASTFTKWLVQNYVWIYILCASHA